MRFVPGLIGLGSSERYASKGEAVLSLALSFALLACLVSLVVTNGHESEAGRESRMQIKQAHYLASLPPQHYEQKGADGKIYTLYSNPLAEQEGGLRKWPLFYSSEAASGI